MAAPGPQDYLAQLERMKEQLAKEATPAVGRISWFGSWWTLLTASINKAKQGLAGERAALRRGLTGGVAPNAKGETNVGWLDDAGDAFDTRWKMADDSLQPWAENKELPSWQGLYGEINEARVAIDRAIEELKLHLQNVATGGHNLNGVENTLGIAFEKFQTVDTHIGQIGDLIRDMPPPTDWNGPSGSTGQPPAGVPADPSRVPSGPGGPSSSVPSAPGGDPSQVATDPAATDPSTAPPGAEQQPPGTPPGGAPPTGPELAGTTPTLTPPGTAPNLPPGLGNLPATPTPQGPFMPPLGGGGIPYPPTALTPIAGAKGQKPGAGLGKSVIGGGGGGKLGSVGLGKHDFGLDSVGRADTNQPPAQAARNMNTRPLPSVPQPPVLPTATSAAGPAPAGASAMPPPMMPPMTGTGGGSAPKPGTAQPVLQGRGRSQSRLPGVPPKLRGRSGKNDQVFKTPAVSRRPKATEAETLDTVQLLDEELWAVEQPAAPVAERARLRSH